MEMRRRTGQWTELFVAIPLAHLEAAFLQECVAQGRDRRNLDAAANLAASAKRLLTLVEAAERARPQPRYSMEMFS
jgi:hypothetical protein